MVHVAKQRAMGNRGPRLKGAQLANLLRTTHFSSKELQFWYRQFLGDCPTGLLSGEDFDRLFKASLCCADESEMFSQIIFASFQRDQNGLVGFEAFVQSLSTILRGSDEERLSWLFSVCDADGDGFVSREDVIYVTNSLYKFLGRIVNFCSEDDLPPKLINVRFHDNIEYFTGSYRKLSKEDFKTFISGGSTFQNAISLCKSFNDL